MKERLVRGTNVASVLRVLRRQRRVRPLPELGDWEQDLLRRRVAPSTWYSLKVFDSLLQLVHRFVYDGSEAAAQTMGRSYARIRLADDVALVIAGDPLATLGDVAGRWRDQYNFGEMVVTPLPAQGAEHGVRVRISAYPDMSACHGHAIVGYTMELAERAGAAAPKSLIEERPWMHNSVLSYTLTWT
ncbi:MAG: hypothetical protein JWN48_1314 [Myxococcaceae bacterium]|nr:hypothetical protein [Myxococcaceae bacterium]